MGYTKLNENEIIDKYIDSTNDVVAAPIFDVIPYNTIFSFQEILQGKLLFVAIDLN